MLDQTVSFRNKRYVLKGSLKVPFAILHQLQPPSWNDDQVEVIPGSLGNRPFPSSLVPLFQTESKFENDFDLCEDEITCRTHFHMKGLAARFHQTKKPNRQATQAKHFLSRGFHWSLVYPRVFVGPLCCLQQLWFGLFGLVIKF